MTTLTPTESLRSRAERRAARRSAARSQTAQPARSYVWWVAGAVILLIGGGIVWWAASGRAKTPVPVGPLLGQQIPDEGHEHVAVGTPIHYKANPPASGTHYPVPAPAGVYPNGLEPGFWVHSLEHGYIVLLYKPPAAPDRLAEFDRMVKDFPRSKFGNVKFLAVPYSDMARPYAVMAWDWRLFMDTFDRATVLLFYKEHVDHGREDIP